MKITDIRFGMLRVPLKTPFKTALRTVDKVEDVIVTIHTDTGHVGYGEAPATAVITGDTLGSIVEAIQKYIAPRIIGMPARERSPSQGQLSWWCLAADPKSQRIGSSACGSSVKRLILSCAQVPMCVEVI